MWYVAFGGVSVFWGQYRLFPINPKESCEHAPKRLTRRLKMTAHFLWARFEITNRCARMLKAGEYVWSSDKTTRKLARPHCDCKHFGRRGRVRLDAIGR